MGHQSNFNGLFGQFEDKDSDISWTDVVQKCLNTKRKNIFDKIPDLSISEIVSEDDENLFGEPEVGRDANFSNNLVHEFSRPKTIIEELSNSFGSLHESPLPSPAWSPLSSPLKSPQQSPVSSPRKSPPQSPLSTPRQSLEISSQSLSSSRKSLQKTPRQSLSSSRKSLQKTPRQSRASSRKSPPKSPSPSPVSSPRKSLQKSPQQFSPQQSPPQQSPPQQSPPQQSPTQQSPTQQSPTQQSPTQKSPLHHPQPQESPLHQSPPQESSLHQSPPQESSLHQSPPQESPLHQSPPQRASRRASSSRTKSITPNRAKPLERPRRYLAGRRIQTWRGQRPIYVPTADGCFKVDGVTDPSTPDYLKRKRGPPKKKNKKPKAQVDEISTTLDEPANISLSETFLEKSSNLRKQSSHLLTLDSLNWKKGRCENFEYALLNKDKESNVAVGLFRLTGQCEKPSQKTSNYTTTFTLMQGRVAFKLEDEPYMMVNKFESVKVPGLTNYQIKNLISGTSILYFNASK